jgi:tetratricopeptide (TPR) repeat protein
MLIGARDSNDQLLAELRSERDSAVTCAADQATLGFALGSCLDAVGEYTQAFEAYQRANRASQEAANNQPRYHHADHELFIDRIIGAYTATSVRPAKAKSTSDSEPVFLCGMYRSGSTLLEQVLAAHPAISAGGELPFIPAIAATAAAPYPERAAALRADQLTVLADYYRKSVRRLLRSAGLYTDKRPDNFLYIGLIKQLFPNAKFLWTRRHPLDNSLSVYFLHLDPSMPYALDLLNAGHYWREHERIMAHWRSCFPDDILAVQYESLVENPRAEFGRALSFLGLDWDERCEASMPTVQPVRTASVWQVREAVHQRSVGRWRHYPEPITGLARYLGLDAELAELTGGA